MGRRKTTQEITIETGIDAAVENVKENLISSAKKVNFIHAIFLRFIL